MSGFEYKVVPAPMRGVKAKGVKGTPARFAHALETIMNEYGAEGWDYQRTDTLPVEERQGLTGKTTTYQNMLVFRRALGGAAAMALPVAALIEDQSDVLGADEMTAVIEPIAAVEPAAEPAESEAAPAEPAPDVAAAEPQVQPTGQTPDPTVETGPHADDTPKAEDAPKADAPAKAEDAPKEKVVFPWNRPVVAIRRDSD